MQVRFSSFTRVVLMRTVRGFFDAIIDRGPIPAMTPLLQREVHDRLEVALGGLPVSSGA